MKNISSRKKASRPIGKIFLLAFEGTSTEICYFRWFQRRCKDIVIKIETKNKNRTAPLQVLERIKEEAKDLRKKDEAWLVIDRDTWDEKDLTEIANWVKNGSNHNLALSNPCFELWLIFHFEDINKRLNAESCRDKIREYFPKYDKSINMNSFQRDKINKAIARAKAKDTPPCQDYPAFGSTVYRLVEKIIEHIPN